MAKPQDKKPNVTEQFDYSKYLPEGFEAADLKKLGGLTPIYSAEAAVEHKLPPCVGWMDRIEKLDIGGEKEKNHDQRYRDFIRVQLTYATKGITGAGDNAELVEVNAGEDILMPMSGAIKNIVSLRAAISDPSKVYLGFFRPTGEQLDTGRPSPMWVIDAQLHPKSVKREGRFALPANVVHTPEISGQGVTPTGAVYNQKTGEIVEKMVTAS